MTEADRKVATANRPKKSMATWLAEFNRKRREDRVKEAAAKPAPVKIRGGCVSLRLVQEVGKIRGTDRGDVAGFLRDIETAKALS